jgi:hypothetical protein
LGEKAMTLKEAQKIHSALLAGGEWMMYCGDEETMKDPEYQYDSDLIDKAIDIIWSEMEKMKNF